MYFKFGKFWGRSSAGRALEWHSRGREFDPHRLHQIRAGFIDSFCHPEPVSGSKVFDRLDQHFQIPK